MNSLYFLYIVVKRSHTIITYKNFNMKPYNYSIGTLNCFFKMKSLN